MKMETKQLKEKWSGCWFRKLFLFNENSFSVHFILEHSIILLSFHIFAKEIIQNNRKEEKKKRDDRINVNMHIFLPTIRFFFLWTKYLKKIKEKFLYPLNSNVMFAYNIRNMSWIMEYKIYIHASGNDANEKKKLRALKQ